MLAAAHKELAQEALIPALRETGVRVVAQVENSSGSTDIAVRLSEQRSAIIRAVQHLAFEDHTALATMISEGDFIWGAIVYSSSAETDPLGLIESFHVDQLDELVARLTALREAFHEAS